MGNCLTSPSIASPPCSPSSSSSGSASSSSSSYSSSSCSSDMAHPSPPSKRGPRAPFCIQTPSPLILPFPTLSDLLSLYRLGPQIGRGQFGIIRCCVEKSSGLDFACKSIPKLRLFSQKEVAAVMAEVQTMQLLSGHPNIVQLHEVVEDKNNVHIIMELCKGGELFGRLQQKGCLGEAEAADVMKTLMETVLYCHAKGVMHRDLKPENILLLENGAYSSSAIKLADFGQALCFTPGQKFSGMAGSAYYMAPEVLQEGQQYGEEVDVWSAGVILYILLSGVPPFWAETDEGIFKAIKEGKPDMVSKPWNKISPPAKDLITRMLCSDVKARLMPHKILEHPWILQHTSCATTNVPEAEAISQHEDQDTLTASTATESTAVDLSNSASALSSTVSSSNGLSALDSSVLTSSNLDPDKGSVPCPDSVSMPHIQLQNPSLQPQSEDCPSGLPPVSHNPTLTEIRRNGLTKLNVDDLLKSLISKLENKILSLFPAMTKIKLQDGWCCSCTVLTNTVSEQTLLIELGQERYLIAHDRTRQRIGWKLLTQQSFSSCTAQAPSQNGFTQGGGRKKKLQKIHVAKAGWLLQVPGGRWLGRPPPPRKFLLPGAPRQKKRTVLGFELVAIQ